MWGRCGTVAAVVLTLLCAVPAADAATTRHDEATGVQAFQLTRSTTTGGLGINNSEDPAPTPWNLAAGDYCTAYKFDLLPGLSGPLLVPDATNLRALTGFDPGKDRVAYQVRHRAGGSSACQGKDGMWGFWTNAGALPNRCATWCGVRHDFTVGRGRDVRPWAAGPDARLVMGARRVIQSAQLPDLGWAYFCAMLADPTGQRLEHCFRLWSSWDSAVYDEPIVLQNEGTLSSFATVVTNLHPDSPYASPLPGSLTTIGWDGSPQDATRHGSISRAQLIRAIEDVNAKVRAMNGGACTSPQNVLMRCYSTNPEEYRLLGVEDGHEMRGTGYLGTMASNEYVATETG